MTADDALTPQARRELEAMDAALAGRPVEPELTELGVLALALRDGRPEPRPAFTRDLDARAAAGFPRRRRLAAVRERLGSSLVLVPGTVLAAVAAVIVTVAIVTGGTAEDGGGGGTSSSGGSAASEAAPALPRRQADSSAPGAGAPEPAPTTALSSPPSGGGAAGSDGRDKRFVERSAALTLAARPADIDRTAADIVAVTERLGGFVASQSVTSSSDGGGGDFVLRVPTSRLGQALSQLSRVAIVRERSQNAQDITAERVSAADRLSSARAYKRSLERRLAAATTEEETQALQARLNRVDRRIAAFRTRLARVDNRAAFANVAVTLVADEDAGAGAAKRDDGSSWSPADAARDALRVLEVAAGVLLVAAAVALPLALVIALLLGARHVLVQRSRQRVLDSV